jgi:hypothetical protein
VQNRRPVRLRWAGLLFAALLAGCSKPAMRGERIADSVSPDGKLTVTTTVNHGSLATGSTSYRVYVHSVHHPDPVLILDSDHTAGPKLSWVNAYTAQISLKCGDIYRFTNFAELAWPNSSNYDNARFVLVDPGSCNDFRLPG